MTRIPRQGSIRIDNATGPKARFVNGIYEPTDELCGELPVYRKIGITDLWLEFLSLRWHLRPTFVRGTNKGMAFVDVERPCLPQDAASKVWLVDMGVGTSMIPLTVTLLSPITSQMTETVKHAQQSYDAEVKEKRHHNFIVDLVSLFILIVDVTRSSTGFNTDKLYYWRKCS